MIASISRRDGALDESRKKRPARGIRYAFVWAIGAPEPKLGGDVMFRHRKKIAAVGLGRPANANCFIQP